MRLIAACFLGLWCGWVHAAVETTDSVWFGAGANAEAGCRLAIATFGGDYEFVSVGTMTGTAPVRLAYCNVKRISDNTVLANLTQAQEACPQGTPSWSANFNTGKCERVVEACPAGTVQNPATQACESACGAGKDAGPWEWPGSVSGGTRYICVNTCTVAAEPEFGWTGADGVAWARGSGKYTGATCNGSDGSGQTPSSPDQSGSGSGDPKPPRCPSGQCPGTVNGANVCVPCSQAPNTNTDTRDNTGTTTSNSGGGGSTEVTTRRDTRCDGTTCTTTTTTTTTTRDGSGNQTGAPTQQTTTTTQSQNSYCTANPTSQQCGGTGSSTGSSSGSGSSTPGTGTGAPNGGSASTGTNGENVDGGSCERNPSAAGCGGQPGTAGELYEKKGKTFSDVLIKFRDAVSASALGRGIGHFFVVSLSGGSCPTWTMQVDYLQTSAVIDFWCSPVANTLFSVMAGVLMVLAGWSAFRIAVY